MCILACLCGCAYVSIYAYVYKCLNGYVRRDCTCVTERNEHSRNGNVKERTEQRNIREQTKHRRDITEQKGHPQNLRGIAKQNGYYRTQGTPWNKKDIREQKRYHRTK